MRVRTALFLAVLIAALNAAALLPLPVFVRGIAAFLLLVPVTGFLLVSALGLNRDSADLELALLALGSGYAIAILGVLALSYVPGGLDRWHILLTVNPLAVSLLVISVRSQAVDSEIDRSASIQHPSARRWLWIGLVTLVLVASVLRLPGLAYSEFQDDEASVLWRSAEMIQGREDALFIHDKGPAEILLTSGIYAATGRINEAAARFPFAIASIAGLLAIYWVGSRLFGPVAGWTAAMLMAVDGYFVGFARVVQYQSVVLLMVLLAAGILYKYVERPSTRPIYLYLASILLATGILAHYEAVIAIIPVAYFALLSLRHPDSTLRRPRNVILPFLMAAAVLAAFYAPFSLHPRFERTFAEITENRIGGSFPYNNLADFFTRTIIYSSTYYVGLLLLGIVAGLANAYRRILPPLAAITACVAVLVGLTLTFVYPEWLVFGRRDFIWLFFALAFLPPAFARKLPHSEKVIWLWFGLAMILALFFVQKPRTHVYNFFIPGFLIVGHVIGEVWRALDSRLPPSRALAVSMTVVAALTFIFAGYVFWLFTYHGAEVLRTWEQNRPPGYWTPYAVPRQNAMFGFPFKNGWKVVGALYASGDLDGPYARNGKRGVATWYTRGVGDCSRDARYYIFTPQNEPINKGLLDPVQRPTPEQGYHLIHVVQVNGLTRMEIFERRDPPAGPPVYHNVEDYEALFDAALSSPYFVADGPTAVPDIQHPLDFRFGDSIWLRGFSLKTNSVRPGERVDLTLYWQADAPPTDRYKVFTQIIDMADYYKAGQRDGIPGCERFPTNTWLPGDIITDRYAITVEDSAREGAYSLLIGMYDDNEERLEIFTADGSSVGDSLGIDTIFIEP